MSRPICKSRCLALAPALALVCHQMPGPTHAQDRPTAPYAPTGHYEVKDIQGWTVLVNRDLLKARPELAEQVLTLLRFNLIEVERHVPAPAVARLRKVRIWVEESQESTNPLCLAYHPDVRAVRALGK